MSRLLVLQHIACEPPAAYEDELRARGLGVHRVEVDEGQALPDWRAFPAIIVMGGPMGAYEEDAHPWLADEKALLAEAVAGGAPVWGVCLGAQLLAAALGARVAPGPAAEVGVLPVHRTEAGVVDPVFRHAPASFPALQWHGDTFDLPGGAVHLARSEAYEAQAFAVGRAYGLQFHIEVDGPLAREWGEVPAYAAALEGTLGPGTMPGFLAQIEAGAPAMTALARRLFSAWLTDVAGLGDAAQGADPVS